MKELIAIQSALKVPKMQDNKFGGYKFRSCEDILEALKPLLLSQDCVITLSDNVCNIGNHNYIEARATLTNSEGIQIYVNGYAREAEIQKGMSDAQITGSASSYARKYALNGLFLIDDTKDDDFTNKHGNDEKIDVKEENKKQEETKETTLNPIYKEIIDFLKINKYSPDDIRELLKEKNIQPTMSDMFLNAKLLMVKDIVKLEALKLKNDISLSSDDKGNDVFEKGVQSVM